MQCGWLHPQDKTFVCVSALASVHLMADCFLSAYISSLTASPRSRLETCSRLIEDHSLARESAMVRHQCILQSPS